MYWDYQELCWSSRSSIGAFLEVSVSDQANLGVPQVE